jgi:predicted amidohydrolase YtcJ
MLITDVRVAGHPQPLDVRCVDGLVAEMGPSLERLGEPVIHGAGAALLPGLHDHHIHLLALAAHLESLQCGPPGVSRRSELASVLRNDDSAGWLRGVDYHESVAGPLDRWQLDRLVDDRPVKIQHRSGKMWIVNSFAAGLLSLDRHAGLPGVELDAGGRPNGRLVRLDDWMRAQLATNGSSDMPSLSRVSRMLAGYGVTGVTDASPGNGEVEMQAFAAATCRGELLQRVRVMGHGGLPESPCERVQRGERKVMLDEHALPGWDALREAFEAAHRQGRAVAVHCVTSAELVLALAVLRDVGPVPGDRIEHASLVPREVLPLLREVGVRVVTQPAFIHERGDRYLLDIPAARHGDLYRCRELLAHDIPVGGSTDAPYGSPDPWSAMRAAVKRESRSGRLVGATEQVTPEVALGLFTGAASDPGGASRRVAVGAPADLCLLNRPWEEARRRLCSEDVRATLRAGDLIYYRGDEQGHGGHHAVVAA